MFALLLIFLATLAFISLIHKHTQTHSKKNPPGPPGLPIIGNLLHFDKYKPHIYLWRLSQKYGPLTYLKHGTTPILVVSSAKMAQQVMKAHDLSFCSRPPVLGQQKLSYGGLDIAFSPYNHHWKEMRKICLLHLLSPKQVLSFRPVREDEVSRMIQKISSCRDVEQVEDDQYWPTMDQAKNVIRPTSRLQPVNLSVMAMSLASNLICRAAFGRRYDDDEFDKKRMDRLVMEAQDLMVTFYFSDYFPAFGWVDKVSGLLDRLDKNCRELDSFYQQLIDEHLDPSRLKPEREDIIDLMIKLKGQKQSASLDFTWDLIKALLMNIFVAGTDTVAATIVWTMTALMQTPTIMKKAQLHIREVIGSKGKVDEDDIKNLPYFKAVVMESLRLYPPAPLLYRAQIPDQECTIDGYKIGPDASVIINAWAIARDSDTWVDPNEFRPERFDDLKIGDEFEMLPFGGGRRGCPGMGVGLASIELALANLLYSFDWALPLGPEQCIDTDALPGLTMHKKSPLVLLPTQFHVQN